MLSTAARAIDAICRWWRHGWHTSIASYCWWGMDDILVLLSTAGGSILHVSTEKKWNTDYLFLNLKTVSPLYQPVSTECNIPFSSNSVFQVRQIPCQSEVTKFNLWPRNALWYMNKMAPCSENSLHHLAAFILMFLNTSVQFLGSNSNDGVLKAENVIHFRVHTPVTPTSARHGLSMCVSTAILHALTLITASRGWLW